jgi:glutamate dehydrogenase (NAD(P)+)
LSECTAVVQGFGNVGAVACDELAKRDVKIIGIGDRYANIMNPNGINIQDLVQHVNSPTNTRRSIQGYPAAEEISSDQLLTMPCDILVPAALEQVIDETNAPRIQCKIIAEGANGPTTVEADAILRERGVFIIPDVLCNAGGVTVSYFEWVQDLAQFMWDEDRVNTELRKQMTRAYERVRAKAAQKQISMRMAALVLGVEKVAKEKAMRGLYP